MPELSPFNVKLKLQSRIRELGYRNYRVAYECSMHEADFSRVINGRRKLTPEQEEKLCEFLESSPIDLGL